jgi:hypothetical protein
MRLSGVFILLSMCFSTLIAVQLNVDEYAQRIFDATNKQRVKQGLQPLIYEESLARVARNYSRDMGFNGFFDHVDRQGRRVADRQLADAPELLMTAIGENLSKNENSNYEFDPEQTVRKWMESPSHRQNLLNPGYTHMGVGVFMMGYKLYTTQVLGVPMLKRLSPLPESVSEGETYKIDFEYLSTKSREGFECSLETPDPTEKIKVTEWIYYEGSFPLEIDWKDDTHFSLKLEFGHGKGVYKLAIGWDGAFYKDMLEFTVR